jgi:hypothetical protein
MHLAILANADSWYAQDLARAAAGKHAITVLNFRDLASELGPDRLRINAGDFDLSQADVVLVRTMPPGSLEQVVFRMGRPWKRPSTSIWPRAYWQTPA